VDIPVKNILKNRIGLFHGVSTVFYRHCPGCGRRFHIELVSKKLAKVDRTSRPKKIVTNLVGGGLAYAASPAVFVVQEGDPTVIDIEEFQYTYKCKHCGHEWAEKRVIRHEED